ncbi:hypothetical protein [Pseudostreptobacillus hongkongensis]|uniref:hypothetical protein n=1 Tax=Pseudostreptobacillus hongkongensis TaxID=1162717 RepID=UPI0028D7E0AD|nr:hypothetical protein [Pseudostreptobacillus hongkongensis]
MKISIFPYFTNLFKASATNCTLGPTITWAVVLSGVLVPKAPAALIFSLLITSEFTTSSLNL